MSEFRLSSRVKVVNPVADIDLDFGPYASIAAAEAAIPVVLRAAGKTVGIIVAGKVVDYSWADGVNLEPKNTGVDVSNKADLVGGKVAAHQLPSYVDDVIELADNNNFPFPGESGKIYLALDTNILYRWSGSGYVEINDTDTYTDTELTTVNAFGIPSGSNLLDLPVKEILRRMLTAFQVPTVEILSLVGYSNVQEVGTIIPNSLTYNLGFTNRQNISGMMSNPFEINAGYYDGTASPITMETSANTFNMDNAGDYTISVYGYYNSQGNGNYPQADYTLTARYKQFFGNSPYTTTAPHEVRALSNSNFDTVNSFVTDIVTSNYYTIAIPTNKTLVTVITANNENITTQFLNNDYIVEVSTANDRDVREYIVYTFVSVLPLQQTLTVTLA
jgi:hypothetical protein